MDEAERRAGVLGGAVCSQVTCVQKERALEELEGHHCPLPQNPFLYLT